MKLKVFLLVVVVALVATTYEGTDDASALHWPYDTHTLDYGDIQVTYFAHRNSGRLDTRIENIRTGEVTNMVTVPGLTTLYNYNADREIVSVEIQRSGEEPEIRYFDVTEAEDEEIDEMIDPELTEDEEPDLTDWVEFDGRLSPADSNRDGHVTFAELDAYNVERGHWMAQGDGSGFPGPPTGIGQIRYEVVNDTKVKVSWVVLGNNLDNSTTRTRVQMCGRGSAEEPARCDGRRNVYVRGAYWENATFANLNSDEEYWFRLRVTNHQGAAEWTDPIRVFMPDFDFDAGLELPTLEQELASVRSGQHYRASDGSSVLMRNPNNPDRVCNVPGRFVSDVETNLVVHDILDRVGQAQGMRWCSRSAATAGAVAEGSNEFGRRGFSAGGTYRWDGINTRYLVGSVCQLRDNNPAIAFTINPGDTDAVNVLAPLYRDMWQRPPQDRFCDN